MYVSALPHILIEIIVSKQTARLAFRRGSILQ